MELTEQEINEYYSLRRMQSNNLMPMLQEDQDRLQFLKFKALQDTCPNPFCVGHIGKEDEVVCPKCGKKLLKIL